MRSLITRTRSFTTIQLRIVLGVALTLLIAVAASAALALRPSPEPATDSPVTVASEATATTTTSPDRSDQAGAPERAGSRTSTTSTRPDGDQGGGPGAPAGERQSAEPAEAPSTGHVTFPEPNDNTQGVEPGEPESSTLTQDPVAAGVPTDYHPPGVPAPATPYDPNLGYSVGTGCAATCITSGVAHANGPGADLEVTTNTSARIWIVVWNDLGSYMEDSGSKVTSFSATFDELEPDTFYYAMAVAEDANGYTDHAYGSFTTLERQIKVSFDTGELISVPDGTLTQGIDVEIWLNGQYQPDAWDQGIAPFGSIHDTVDLRMRVVAHHPQGQCWGQPPTGSSTLPAEHGNSAHRCFTWVMLGSWDASGAADPVSVRHDDAAVETDTYRKVERTLTVNPTHSSDLDAIVHMTVEIVYL